MKTPFLVAKIEPLLEWKLYKKNKQPMVHTSLEIKHSSLYLRVHKEM